MQEHYESYKEPGKKANKSPAKAWDNYKNVRDSTQLTSIDIVETIEKVSQIDLRIAAFLAVLYVTGSRVHEIIHYKYKGIFKDDIRMIEKPGVRIKDFWTEKYNDKEFMIINTRIEKSAVLKNMTDNELIAIKLEKTPMKKGYILVDETSIEFPLYDIIGSYINQLSFKKVDPNLELFSISYMHSWRLIKKYLAMSPHNLRSLRAKHQLENGFTVSDLKTYFGWGSAEMPMRYAASNEKDIFNKLIKNVQ